MTNSFFDSTNWTRLVRGTKARATQVNAITDAVVTGFDRLPAKAKLEQDRVTYSTDTGTANHYIATLDATITALTEGLFVSFKAANANTGPSDLVAGGFLATLKKNISEDLELGDIAVGQIVDARYDGTNWQMLSGPASASAAENAAAASAAAAAASASSSSGSASSSASSAATAAAAAANLVATSTTSLLIATGSKSFTTQAGKAFQSGGFITAASHANPANYMFGQVTSYSGTSLVLNVLAIGGSGTLADWDISVSGVIGPTGATGPGGAGSGDVVGPAGATSGRIATFNGATGKLLQDGGLAITNGVTAASQATPAANKYLLYTGASAGSAADISANGQSFLAAANYAAMLALLGYTFPGNKRVMFDDSGVLGGDADLTWDKTTNTLTLGADALVDLDSATAAPSAPAANSIRQYSKRYSRAQPFVKTEDGFDFPLQPMLGSSWHMSYSAANNGGGILSAGTSTDTPASTVFTDSVFANTNYRTRNKYTRVGQAAAVGCLGGTKNLGSGRWYRSATAGLGGFRAEFLFALADNATGYQFFCGLTALTTDLAGDPSAMVNIFGVGFDAADASGSTFFIMQNDGSGTATRTATTGITRNTTNAFRLILDCPQGNASTLYYHLTDMNTGTVFSGSITTDLPAADTVLKWMMEQRSGAVNATCRVDFYHAKVDSPLN